MAPHAWIVCSAGSPYSKNLDAQRSASLPWIPLRLKPLGQNQSMATSHNACHRLPDRLHHFHRPMGLQERRLGLLPVALPRWKTPLEKVPPQAFMALMALIGWAELGAVFLHFS